MKDDHQVFRIFFFKVKGQNAFSSEVERDRPSERRKWMSEWMNEWLYSLYYKQNHPPQPPCVPYALSHPRTQLRRKFWQSPSWGVGQSLPSLGRTGGALKRELETWVLIPRQVPETFRASGASALRWDRKCPLEVMWGQVEVKCLKAARQAWGVASEELGEDSLEQWWFYSSSQPATPLCARAGHPVLILQA